MSVAVVRRGRMIFAAGFGTSDAALRIPASATTRYGVGSVTKTLVAALILRLAEQRRLSLNDRLVRWLPAFEGARGVRVHHLLEQTSGIRDDNDAAFLATVLPHVLPGRVDRGAVLAALAGWPLEFEPGTRFAYSNSNYLLLGVIAERATRQQLRALLDEQLFMPLGMRDTALAPPRTSAVEEAAGFTKTPFGPRAVAPWDPELTFAAGGLRSTVLDLATFDVALCTGRIVSPASFVRMTSSARLNDGSPTGYGEGFYVYDDAGRHVAWHDGTVLGYKAMHSLLPATCDAVIVLANADYYHAAPVAMQIEHATFGLPGGSGERLDPNLPRWSSSMAAFMGLLPLVLALWLRRRRIVTGVAAVVAYCVGSVWLPAGAAVAGLAIVMLAWPPSSGTGGRRARSRPLP